MVRKILLTGLAVVVLACLFSVPAWVSCSQQPRSTDLTARDRLAKRDRLRREAQFFRTLKCAHRIELACTGEILEPGVNYRVGPIVITDSQVVQGIAKHFLNLKNIGVNEHPFRYSFSGPHATLTFICKDPFSQASAKVDGSIVLLFDSEACTGEPVSWTVLLDELFDIARRHAAEHPGDVFTVRL